MANLDLWPVLESLTIRTKSGRMHKLNRNDRFAWAQRDFVAEVERQYNAGEPVRIIVLKGRQLGLSTITEAILFIWCFLHEGTNALVLSKEKEDAEYLFGMTKRYWELGPFYGMFPEKYNRQGYLEWGGVNSSFFTSTASKENVGRGKTLQAVHCSEVAFWPNADGIVGSLGESIPNTHGTIVVMESTAQGVGGYFHDEWMKAVDPGRDKSMYTALFYPWWKHDEYSIPESSIPYSDLDEEERDLLDTYPDITLPKLAWRRRKLTTYSNPEKFNEEYPSSWETAFLSTGHNVFPLQKLYQCYKPDVEYKRGFLYNDTGRAAFADDEDGHLWVYREPDPRRGRRYAVAVDPSWTVEGDPCCIQVLDRASMEQVAVWHGKADPRTIGETALLIAYWYGKETILNTEVQGGGRIVMGVWRDANYPNLWMDRRTDRPKLLMNSYGWNATFETKRTMIGTMQSVIQRRQLLIHHPATYYEMTRYVTDEDGNYGPSRRSGHDDTVTSLGIAIYTVTSETGSLEWAAMAAPAPAHIPGQTPIRFPGQGKPLPPSIASRFGAEDSYNTEDSIGVESWY